MNEILNKIDYSKYFNEFKRKHSMIARDAVTYSIVSYDTIKVFLKCGDYILYNINNDSMEYINNEDKEMITAKRKQGRPSKFKNGAVTITARIDILERDKLQALCDYHGKTPSDIIRDLIDDKFEEIYKR